MYYHYPERFGAFEVVHYEYSLVEGSDFLELPLQGMALQVDAHENYERIQHNREPGAHGNNVKTLFDSSTILSHLQYFYLISCTVRHLSV